MSRPSLADVLARHRIVVCVGTGGVGKTTTAAALGVAGALSGRRTMVLTIDPARQLARALGLDALRRGGEEVPRALLDAAQLEISGTLHAGMLDQKGAWDAFITRHAPTPAVRDTLLHNAFYQKISTSFAGSTEFMAIDELCELDESGRYDLIVIDTPPAGAAVDFVRAPERIDRLLDPEVTGFLSRPFRGGPWGAMSSAVPFVMRRLDRAFGAPALREISAFFAAFQALFSGVAERSARARALLHGDRTAFVLVAGPKERVLADGHGLARAMKELGIPLRATVVNRVHPFPETSDAELAATLSTLETDGASAETIAWLGDLAAHARETSRAERARLDPFLAELPPGTAWIEVPELERDARSLEDLAALARIVAPL
jgi:anion-transporting  ArsA/GET3 family ATPase